jgi:hypothetical protein
MNALTEKEVEFAVANNNSNLDIYNVYVYSITYDVRRVAMPKGLTDKDLRNITKALDIDLYDAQDDSEDGGVYEKIHDIRYMNLNNHSAFNDFSYYVSKDASNSLVLREI